MQRRRLLGHTAALVGAAFARPSFGAATGPLTRQVPSSGEALPVVGLGTWITFNVGRDPAARERCAQVLEQFLAAGGRLVDSSPMYGSAQGVVGDALTRLDARARVFSADKVWTSGDGATQAEQSRRLWGVQRFDLLQVHNLLAWQTQLPLLLRMKEEGRLRHVGITTSEGRRHGDFEQLMRSRTPPLDFVQLTYNPVDRQAEQRLLPLALERGIAVLANRPFRQGDLLAALRGQALPGWAAEIGCRTWAQAVLKFIVSHPAVTCAIPATSNPAHASENMAAAHAPLPDPALRARIAQDVARMA